MTFVFGDTEPLDAFSAEGTPDPFQVGLRIHELRAYLDELAGLHQVARYGDLSTEERRLADAIAAAIVEWMLTHEPDDPVELARELHGVRRFLSRGVLPEWEALPDDHRALAVALMGHIVDWLEREGTI